MACKIIRFIPFLCSAIFLLATNAFAEQPVVYGWGADYYGANIPPPALSNVIAIAAGDAFSMALQSNGTAAAWGYNGHGEANVPPGLSNVVAIAAGEFHSLALQSNGFVVAWGDNSSGETNVPPGLSNVVAIAACGYNSLALRSNGTVVAWGFNGSGQINVPLNLSNVVAIASGNDVSLALQSNGSVVVWGDNSSGETNVPPNLSNVVAVAAGWQLCLALRNNGTVVVWGDNTFGETNVPPGLSNVVAIAAHSDFCLALQSNGTVVAWGENVNEESSVPTGLSNVVAIAAGDDHSLSLTYNPPSAPPPPVNDDFTNAIVITGNNYSVTASNAGATTEPGERVDFRGAPGSASVWWTWTPQQNTSVTIVALAISPFFTVVGVYNGDSVSNLALVADAEYGTDAIFIATAHTQYYIAVDGYGGGQGSFTLSLSEASCAPQISFTTTQTNEADGIHVIVCADVTGNNLGAFNWSVNSPPDYIKTINDGTCFEVVVSPTEENPVSVNMTVSNPCGNGGGNSTPVSPCSMCLSRGSPSLLTGTIGGGSAPTNTTLDCGNVSANALWYSMISPGTGLVTVSTEGSSYETLLAAYIGVIGAMTNLACYNGFTSSNLESRVTFNVLNGYRYWIAVDSHTNSTAKLRVATGFAPNIQSFALMPDGSFTIQSSTAPPITYELLASSTLTTNTNAWTVVLTTNLTLGSPNITYRDTNVHGVQGRFYRLGP